MRPFTAITVALLTACSMCHQSPAGDLRVPVRVDDGSGNFSVVPGIFVKLITARECEVLDEPDGSPAVDDVGDPESPAPPFQFYYQLKTEEDEDFLTHDGRKWYRVGYSSRKPVGWICETDSDGKQQVILWNTRSLLDPRSEQVSQTTPFTIYLGDDMQLGGNSRAELVLAGQQKAICPILDPPQNPDEPIYHVAFFAGMAQTAGDTGSTVGAETLKRSEITEEIIFVVDTTASMTGLLDGVKELTHRTVESLSQRGELSRRVRFGLVEYRDCTPRLFPGNAAARVTIPLTNDTADFQRRLASVVVTDRPSEETKEDVLAGLHTALTDPRVGWQENSLKHLVLLGDASAHLDGPKNTTGLSMQQVIDMASPSGGGSEIKRLVQRVTLHTVRAVNPDDPADGVLCAQQFDEFRRNNGNETGFGASVSPSVPGSIDAGVSGLVAMIDLSFDAMAGKAPPAASGKPVGAMAAKVYELFELSDNEKNKEVLEGVTDGLSEQGRSLASSCILVQFGELESTASNLRFMHESLGRFADDPAGRENIDSLLQGIQSVVAAQGAGNFVSSSHLGDVISVLPLKSKSLKVSMDDIATMTDDQFAAFLAEIDASRRRCQSILDDNGHWNSLMGRETDNRSKFAFLTVDSLP